MIIVEDVPLELKGTEGIVSCTYDFRLRYLVAYDAFRAFEFEGHVLDDNKLKFFHYIWVK